MPSYDISYTYDGCGNRLTKTDNLASQTTTYTYDAANQLTSSQTGASTTNYTYDAAGNQVSDGTVTNTWDDENRRTKADLGGGQVVTMTYNGTGLRVKKEEPATTTKYVWDGQNYLLETDNSNVKTALNTYKPEQYGSLISRGGPGGNVFFHFDALGSTINVTDSSQTVLETYVYEAFGTRVSTNSFKPPFLYVGRLGYYHDELTQEYYVRQRTYLPQHGRFLSVDPIALQFQLYVYAVNCPTVFVDPSGHIHISIVRTQNVGDEADCGDVVSVQWLFALNASAPCDGYFVQRNTVYSAIGKCSVVRECPYSPWAAGDSLTKEFFQVWEAWWVNMGEANAEINIRDYIHDENGERRIVRQNDYTDSFAFEARNRTCGSVAITGMVKFFCKETGPFSVGTGDLGREDTLPSDSSSRWRPGNRGGVRQTGLLPSVDAKPEWWDAEPAEGAAHHFLNLTWCCCGKGDFVRASYGPR
jgi:RHS repeat-associated protein